MESRLREGTTFWIALKTIDGELEGDAQRLVPIAAVGRRATVLLVEDSSEVRRLARNVLEEHACVVLEASSGSQAVEIAAAHQEIDVVLTDVVMSGGSGSMVVNWFTANRPGTPVGLMSGYNEDEQVRRGVRAGTLPLLAKPYHPTDLVAFIDRLLIARPAKP